MTPTPDSSNQDKKEFWQTIEQYFGEARQPHDWQQQLTRLLQKYEPSNMQEIKAQVSQLSQVITGSPILNQPESAQRSYSGGTTGESSGRESSGRNN